MPTVYLSTLAGKPLTEYLTAQGFALHFIDGKNSPVYNEISTHADIYMCQMGLWENSRIFMGNIHELGSNYPGNIIYNAICTGKYFIHNLKYTDPDLLTAAEAWHADVYADIHEKEPHTPHAPLNTPLIKVNVPQGYARCTCLPVDDDSFITSDAGTAKSLSAHDANVLLIEQGHIKLLGFDYGFIGGCAGNLSVPKPESANINSLRPCSTKQPHSTRRAIVFNGNLAAHPDYKKIAAFIKDRDIELIYFNEYPLEDIGSILTEK